MKIKTLSIVSVLMLFASVPLLTAQNDVYDRMDDQYKESCTSIMVGKKASVDGSVMTAHTCDANYRTYVTIEPRKSFTIGSTEPVYVGLLHNEEPWDMRNVVEKGRIPVKAENTYQFLNVAYPCLNEKQLAIGETTTEGRPELVNKNGMFQIEELERMALQYCTTAREAIALMGKLAEQYGYGDWGECLTVADKNEVWHFEIYGTGAGNPGALWVAQRIPDDHVGISANIPRIGKVDFKDKDNFMTSSDLKERSKKTGYWDGKEPYIFHKVVSGRKPFSIREFYVLSTLAPSLNLKYDAEELPFSVKPEQKVSPEKMFELYRATYEGTEYNMVKNLSYEASRRVKQADGTYKQYKETVYPLSNFMPRDLMDMLNQVKPGVVERQRTIAVIQCSYSHIIQLRNWLPDEIGGVAYFAFDNPAQSPRIPIYAGTTSLPASFNICGQHRYREDAAIWSFRETNRIATINWDKSRKILEPERAMFEKLMMDQNKQVEAQAAALIKEGKVDEAKTLITNHTRNFATMTMNRWKELKASLWELFIRSM
ncbi:MAG: C69 family dipeptidase [Bacteroidales bacterium]|nr:C69 family dipeptidase [Bacteroidales bacterium]MDD4669943.1 C69 family dipeptidase [Bacteroidales bacterium]